MFPNPASERFNLQFEAPTAGDYLTRLVAPDGRVVREIKQTISGGSANVQWNIDGLASGVYLYQVSGNAGIQTGKVVIR
ncbi:T9SS type A sorting domain-containing protein [Neolewinella lacunae]|uniref:T9SS type A sorting domain-containing protein n=1 Tax=Neolewinella lacunae TaxID=1517758 RepID=A0A923PHP4_9BACT|nr:T9SS type A sorting domain-containing protein [Neolewinella lacunae]MBC6993479.1 T9SS type A sorting domain-containing protein [Neolewinella lacunae]MDN3636245.1 T9SS type A sorting domain-containing protein [Neolewinella lacunae]